MKYKYNIYKNNYSKETYDFYDGNKCIIDYNDNNIKISEAYFHNNDLINYKNFQSHYEFKYISDINFIVYTYQFDNVTIQSKEYYLYHEGEEILHNDSGAAEIYYDYFGNITEEQYWIYGKFVPKEILKNNPTILTDRALQKILL